MSEWWRATEDNEINSERRVSGDRRKFAVPQKSGRNKCEVLVDGPKTMFLTGGSWCVNNDTPGAIPEFTVQPHEKQCKERAMLRARAR